jgi:hypothetical protein
MGGFPRITRFQLGHASLQPRGIQLIDRKNADTTLRTPGPTDEPMATATRGIGECSVDNLHQGSVIYSERVFQHSFSQSYLPISEPAQLGGKSCFEDKVQRRFPQLKTSRKCIFVSIWHDY